MPLLRTASVDGLLETGDIEGPSVPQALQWATNQQLLSEINRRSEPEATRLFGKTPGIINPEIPTGAQVFDLPGTDINPAAHDGTVTDWDGTQPHAAEGSEEEDGNPDDYIP
ncbi:MAG TPA: hypothetical protein VFC72_02685 [Corynebacterium sp.]|nr:hypothetical protein [Corynebacterium sp.]